METAIESPDDLGKTEADRVKRWLAEIDLADRHEKDWRQRAKEVIEVYRDESRDEKSSLSEFNILWSNTETLKPSLYSSTPRPDVRRRYRDEDVVGREVAKVLERGISFQVDTQDFDCEILAVIEDYLLPGRGVARERYVPTMVMGDPPQIPVQMVPVYDEDTEEVIGNQFLAEGEEVDEAEVQYDPSNNAYFKVGEPMEEVAWEEVRTEYVLWENFRQSTEALWRDKRWIAFGTEMTRDELVQSFGDVGNEVTLTDKKDPNKTDDEAETGENPTEGGNFLKTAFVWEVWDKQERRVMFVTEGLKDKFLLDQDDPLHLQDFFPCPEPLISVKTNDSSIPIPEYTMYQDLAQELNTITDRISKLITALKVRGVYDTQFKSAMEQLLGGSENELIPIDTFGMMAEKGGIEGVISWMPIEQIGKVLVGLYNQRTQIINTIYEITGISDIMRGATDPRETAKAQELKGQFGSMRIKPRQRDVQRFVRDLFRIKAEIMAELFEPETLAAMTQTEITPEVIQVLKDDALRTYKVDVETDSTIAEDERRDKADVVELFQGMGEFIGAVGPMVQEGAIPKESALAMLLWAMRKFKVSRDIEDQLSRSMEQAGQQEQQQAGAEQVDPVAQAQAQALMAEEQRKQQESAQKLQMEAQQMQAEQQRKDAEAQQKMALEREEFQREQQRKDALNQAKIQAIARQEAAREKEMRSQGQA